MVTHSFFIAQERKIKLLSCKIQKWLVCNTYMQPMTPAGRQTLGDKSVDSHMSHCGQHRGSSAGPRACNEHKDSRMVHALHEQPRARRPRAPMIQCAGREQDSQRRHIDAARCLGLGQKRRN